MFVYLKCNSTVPLGLSKPLLEQSHAYNTKRLDWEKRSVIVFAFVCFGLVDTMLVLS